MTSRAMALGRAPRATADVAEVKMIPEVTEGKARCIKVITSSREEQPSDHALHSVSKMVDCIWGNQWIANSRARPTVSTDDMT